MTMMNVKERVFREDSPMASPLAARDGETTLVQSLVDNQSPVMKAWFILMVVNMALFLLLIN